MRMRGRIVAVVGAVLAAVAARRRAGPGAADNQDRGGRAPHRPARQAGAGGRERRQAGRRGMEREGRRPRQEDRGHGRRRPGQPAGRRGRGARRSRPTRGHGRGLGHHQRHLHPGLRGPGPGQPRPDQPGLHQPEGHRPRPQDTSTGCARATTLQGPAGAIFAVEELKAKKIAIFDDGTTGPKGAADEVEKKAKAMGATALRYVIRAGRQGLPRGPRHRAEGHRT